MAVGLLGLSSAQLKMRALRNSSPGDHKKCRSPECGQRAKFCQLAEKYFTTSLRIGPNDMVHHAVADKGSELPQCLHEWEVRLKQPLRASKNGLVFPMLLQLPDVVKAFLTRPKDVTFSEAERSLENAVELLLPNHPCKVRNVACFHYPNLRRQVAVGGRRCDDVLVHQEFLVSD